MTSPPLQSHPTLSERGAGASPDYCVLGRVPSLVGVGV